MSCSLVTSFSVLSPAVFALVWVSFEFPHEPESETEVEGKYVLMNLTGGYVGKFIELPNEFEGKIGVKYRVRYK